MKQTKKTKYRIYSINRPGRLLNFWTVRVGAYSRWALIRGWALIRINTVTVIVAGVIIFFFHAVKCKTVVYSI